MSDIHPELFESKGAYRHGDTPKQESLSGHDARHSDERPVLNHLQRLEDEIRHFSGSVLIQECNSLSEKWNATFSALGEHFRECIEQHDFSGDTAPTDRLTLWHSVRELRAAVCSGVFGVLEDFLTEQGLPGFLRDHMLSGVESIESVLISLPERIDRYEPSALYRAREGDSGIIKIRKAGVRWARAARVFGKKKDYTQRVYVRALVDHHLRTEVFPVLSENLDAVLRVYVRSLALLENKLMAWIHAALDAERDLDDSAFHDPFHGIESQKPEAFPTRSIKSVPGAAKNAESSSGSELAIDGEADKTEAEEDQIPDYDESLRHLATASEVLLSTLMTDAQVDVSKWSIGLETTLDESIRSLRVGVQSSSTFMAALDEAEILESPDTWSLSLELDPRFTGWFDEAADRMRFCMSLSSTREEMTRILDDLIAAITSVSIEPISRAQTSSADEFRHLVREAEGVFDQALRFGEFDGLDQRISDWQEKGLKLIQTGVLDFVETLSVNEAVRDAIDRSKTRSIELPGAYPGSFRVHDFRSVLEKRGHLTGEYYQIGFSDFLAAGIDESLVSRIESAPVDLLTRIDRVIREVTEIPSIIEFNLVAARDELKGKTGDGGDKDVTGADKSAEGVQASARAGAARELTVNGLARSSEALITERNRLRLPLSRLVEQLFMSFEESWRRIHDRSRVENQVRKYIIGARSSLEDQRRRLTDSILLGATTLWANVVKIGRMLRMKANALIRIGREAVGEPVGQEITFQETIEALSDLDEMLESVPLVYRRLFSFSPLNDRDLLVGRDSDKLFVANHVERWENGITQSLVLNGAPSCGQTSFLNVIRQTVLANCPVQSLVLEDRILDEKHLTQVLIEALELEYAADAAPKSLSELNTLILSIPRSGELRVFIIEHLEHLFLRTIGGSALIAKFFTLMSRTDSRILWIATISDFGWQYLNTSEPAASALVASHQLAKLERTDIEKLIMSRHRKSGLAVIFESKDTVSPIFKRRLKKAKTDEDQQVLFREAYFDRMHAQCGQNIMLALYYWIRSVTVNEGETGVQVSPLEPIKFAFLGVFSLAQAVTLKALLDHCTLTIEEFASVNHIGLDESLALFESLANALLIETVGTNDKAGHFSFLSVQSGVRYRIRPLTVHPVIQFLRGKNIVH